MSPGIIKYLLGAFAVVAAVHSASGQDIALFKEKLMRPTVFTDAKVEVAEDESAVQAIRRYEAMPKPEKVAGYRIRIFFDNGQNARSQALQTQARFLNEFPGIPTFLVYENPSYVVTVGNCATIDEALMLWNKVRRSFSTAFLWRGQIPVRELFRQEEIPAEGQQKGVPQAEGPNTFKGFTGVSNINNLTNF